MNIDKTEVLNQHNFVAFSIYGSNLNVKLLIMIL